MLCPGCGQGTGRWKGGGHAEGTGGEQEPGACCEGARPDHALGSTSCLAATGQSREAAPQPAGERSCRNAWLNPRSGWCLMLAGSTTRVRQPWLTHCPLTRLLPAVLPPAWGWRFPRLCSTLQPPRAWRRHRSGRRSARAAGAAAGQAAAGAPAEQPGGQLAAAQPAGHGAAGAAGRHHLGAAPPAGRRRCAAGLGGPADPGASGSAPAAPQPAHPRCQGGRPVWQRVRPVCGHHYGPAAECQRCGWVAVSGGGGGVRGARRIRGSVAAGCLQWHEGQRLADTTCRRMAAEFMAAPVPGIAIPTRAFPPMPLLGMPCATLTLLPPAHAIAAAAILPDALASQVQSIVGQLQSALSIQRSGDLQQLWNTL